MAIAMRPLTRRTVAFGVIIASAAALGAQDPASIVPVGGDLFVGLEGGGAWTFECDGGAADGAVRSVALGTGANRRVVRRQ
jgi:hypothetical protein